ncbi:MAG TPA: murein biosynthesis integral membrane protein MurJ [Ktedonobacteraceae bacterium]|nr:murein biosynthesis integral membrane protein MurJ [Ktedonobacteraceae bacterium]
MSVSTIEPEADIVIATPEEVSMEDEVEDEVTSQQPHIGFGVFRFRFNLANFRLGRDISDRRFSIAEAALLLMAAYLASRGLGVVRQSIFNALFGTSDAANAYYAAFRLPDFLFNLIAGGALTHAFVPVFVTFDKEKGRQAAWRLTSLIFNIMLVSLTAIVLVGEILAPVFVSHILVPGYSAQVQDLTTSLTRIMLIQPLILGLGTIATSVLSSKRQFLLPALSIAVYNFGLIAGLVCTLIYPPLGIYGPTYGVLLAALCQVVVQIPGLVRQGIRYSFVWNLRDSGLRQVLNLLGPNALIVMLGSTAFIIDTAFASYLPDLASLSAQHNAYMLFYVPVALLSQAVSQPVLPQLSLLAARGNFLRMQRLTARVTGASLLLGIPATLGLCILGKPVIHLIFQHGAFDSHSTTLTALALIGYAVGLPAIIASEMFVRAFFAVKDARVPLFTNIFNLSVHIALILTLLKVYTGQNAILAIPLAASGSATAECILLGTLLYFRLRRKIRKEMS